MRDMRADGRSVIKRAMRVMDYAASESWPKGIDFARHPD